MLGVRWSGQSRDLRETWKHTHHKFFLPLAFGRIERALRGRFVRKSIISRQIKSRTVLFRIEEEAKSNSRSQNTKYGGCGDERKLAGVHGPEKQLPKWISGNSTPPKFLLRVLRFAAKKKREIPACSSLI